MYIYEEDRDSFRGRRVRCIEMKDEHPVPSGTEGTVVYIDDIGTVHVKWDNGSTLGLVPKEDSFEFIDKKCTNPSYGECPLFIHSQCKNCPVFI